MWIKLSRNLYKNVSTAEEIRIQVYTTLTDDRIQYNESRGAGNAYRAVIHLGKVVIQIPDSLDIESDLVPYRSAIEELISGKLVIWDLSGDPNVPKYE